MATPRPGPADSVAGFTLTELVMVLVVVAIVSAIALSRVGINPVLVSTQSEQLAADIRYVQTLAMTQAQRHIISFPSATSYRFLDSAGNPVVHPVNGSNAAIILGSGSYAGASSDHARRQRARIRRARIPYSVTTPATFNGALTAQATITLSRDAESRGTTIAHQTGKVTP